ncbi:kinase-like domain-containing protein [Suillus paluster]|uniref:kinase-like domain-containing protein n=1 Tax=Suillus paluster TaxID=48578 RepID=UPI001B885A02|nr:kinase-like domain-containing protein [Suillus paluster]KAG1751383.1 kinase-like domain-containing protein [Suillus paluster]
MADAFAPGAGLCFIAREQFTKKDEWPVAAGGYGQVFQCTMQPPAGPEVLVAVKVLLHITDDVSSKRARREMKLWMEARHENIVPMLGVTDGFSKEALAMVSLWMEGGTLARYLEVHKEKIPYRKKLHLLRDIASGLAYLHSRRIVHGDLTPNNIMLDDNERALLIDFGLSNVLGGIAGSCLTPSPALPGAVRFAAPELLCVHTGEGLPVDNQQPIPDMHSDIYSLGCVMLNVLTEQQPWYRYHCDGWAILAAIYGRQPVPIPDHSHLSEKHKQFIRKCTSARAEGRPSSQDVVVFLEEELRIKNTAAPMHKLDTKIPRQVPLDSIQMPNAHPFSQYESDNVSPNTLHSALSYATCLTSLRLDFPNAAYSITPITPRCPLGLSDESLTSQSPLFAAFPSRTRHSSTATVRPNPNAPDLTAEAPTEVPNSNSPPVPVNSPSREYTIVIAGAIGSGKSSLVNLLSGTPEPVAPTSNDVGRCTTKWKDYPISFRGTAYKVFDTVGLASSNCTPLEPKARSGAMEKYAKQQIKAIHDQGGIDLLLFCVPSRNFHVETVLNDYRRLEGELQGRQVPVVLVITHLDEPLTFESWWSKNSPGARDQMQSIADHICITSIHAKYLEQSRNHIFRKIAHYCSEVREL